MPLGFSLSQKKMLKSSLEATFRDFSLNCHKLLLVTSFFFLGLTSSYFYPLSKEELTPTEKSKLIATICLNAIFSFAFFLVIRKARSSFKFFAFKDKIMILLAASTLICNYELYWISNKTEYGGIVALFLMAFLPSVLYVSLIDRIIHWTLAISYYCLAHFRVEGSLLVFLIAINGALVLILYLQLERRNRNESLQKSLTLEFLLQLFNMSSAQANKVYMLIDKNSDLVFANEGFYKFFEVSSENVTNQKMTEILKEITQVSCTENLANIIGEKETELLKKTTIKSMKYETELIKRTSTAKGQIFKSLASESLDESMNSLVKFLFDHSKTLKHFNVGWNSEQSTPVFYPALAYYEAQQFFVQLAYVNFYKEDLVLIELTTNEKAKDFMSTPSNLSMTDIASIIHEIRTPLNGTIFLMQQALEDSTVPMQVKSELLVPSLISSKRLSYIVNDILDFAQILEGKFKLSLESFDLVSTLNECLQIIVALAKAKGLEVFLEIDPKVPQNVTTDQNRLVQIVYNLMGNAIKFTKEGYIKLMVTLSPIEPRFIEFAVQDTGYGIKEEDLKKLFKLFEKLDNWHDNKVGSGLGLSIGNAIAKALGKKITVVSEYKKGSIFKFSIENKENSLNVPKTPITSNRTNLTLENTERLGDLESYARRNRLCSIDVTKTKSLEIGSLFDPPKLASGFSRKESNEIVTELSHFKNKTVHYDFNFPSSHVVQAINKRKEETYNIRIDPGIDEALKEDEEMTDFGFYNRSNSGLPFLTSKLDNSNMIIMSPNLTNRCRCPKILSADDEPINTLSLQFILREIGLKGKFFNSGFSIIDYVVNNRDSLACTNCKGPLFILMDCYMPTKDGFETTNELLSIMKEYKMKKTPIIACTADDSEDIDTKIKECGMSDRVSKPLTKTHFEALIRKYTLMQQFEEMGEVEKIEESPLGKESR